ncbi:MAG: hypothetical protein AAGD01_17770 [Acidobacteriota bacterium]
MSDTIDHRPQPESHLHRWLKAEAGGYRREADRALRELFRAVPRLAPSAGFRERVVAAALRRPLFQRPEVRGTLAGVFAIIAATLAVAEAAILVAGAHLGLDGLAAACTRFALGSFEAVDFVLVSLDRLAPIGRILMRTFQTPETLIGLSATVMVALAAFRVVAELTTYSEEPQHVDSV